MQASEKPPKKKRMPLVVQSSNTQRIQTILDEDMGKHSKQPSLQIDIKSKS